VGRALLVALIAALAMPASVGTASPSRSAAPSKSSFVVMYRDDEPTVGGGGLVRLYTSRAGPIKLSGNRFGVTVWASGPESEDSTGFEFAAARGTKLRSRLYLHAQRTPFRDRGHPGIDIYGGGWGCNKVSGSFQVKDIAFARNGALKRLWVVYEHHCEERRPAQFGEIRVGEPKSRDPVLVMPGTVRWPANDVGRTSTAVPVTLLALRAPVMFNRARIVGRNAGAFSIRNDGCSGRALAIGASCQILVRHEPRSAGTHLATLRVVDSRGRRRSVSLQGFAFGGRSAVDLTSDPGDYIGGGRPWSFTFANAEISGGGTRKLIGFGASNTQESFSAGFAPAPGGVIAPGTYRNARRWPFNEGNPGLDIGSRGKGCNYLEGVFTVNSAAWWRDGTLRSASVTFEQHCEGGAPALRGTFAFRAGDKTPLPWWLGGRRRS
jgi:hypothetical protein